MSIVISASRRTDLAAFFPAGLASDLREERARVLAPRGKTCEVDLRPENVHTIVLWSKNFANLIGDRFGLRGLLAKYEQAYFHFTITGLGGGFIEPGCPRPEEALAQIPEIVRIAGSPERVSIRFDPVLFWREGGAVRTNLDFFERLAPSAAAAGIRTIRFSFAQWYGKARARARRRGFEFVDPGEEEKRSLAAELGRVAADQGFDLWACSQGFLAGVPGVRPSSCIDGRRLGELHPRREPVSSKKDRTQRPDCLCTESRDIGSYSQACPHGCVYCYADPEE
jgi:hypothetical protein